MLKSLYALILLIFLSTGSLAQNNPDELQLMQSLYGMEKRDIVAEFVELNEYQEAEFWKLYDAYELKRQELGKERFRILSSYVNDYGEVKPEKAERFMNQAISLRIKTDKLVDGYYKKIKTATDPVVAMQFYQIEVYLADVIRLELLEEIYTSKE